MSTIKLNLSGFDLVNSQVGTKLGSIARDAVRTAERYSVGQLNQSDLGPSIRFTMETYHTVRAIASIPLSKESQHSAFAVFRDAIAEEAEKFNVMLQQQQAQQAQLMSPQLPPANTPDVDYLEGAEQKLLESSNSSTSIPIDDDLVEIIDGDVIEVDAFEVIPDNQALIEYTPSEGGVVAVIPDNQSVILAPENSLSTVVTQPGGQSFGNMSRAQMGQTFVGNQYTGFYADLFHGENAITGDLLAGAEGSFEGHLNFANVDWNDAQSRADYFNRVTDMAKNVNLREHMGANVLELFSGEQELMILLHTENKEAYGQYIAAFEQQIQANFDAELKSLQDAAKNQLGYTGKMNDIKAMEKFSATLTGSDKAIMDDLIQATQGKTNKVDKYILARINSGQIDIDKILKTGQFAGTRLSQKELEIFAALKVFANSDSIATTYHNNILQGIGFESKMKNIDLNNIHQVEKRVAEFEKALTQTGVGPMLYNKKGKALSWNNLNIKNVRKIDLSKFANNPEMQKAVQAYIGLKEHHQTLHQTNEFKKDLRNQIVKGVQKLFGDSDLSNAIGEIDKQYHNYKMGKAAARQAVKITRSARNAFKAAQKKVGNKIHNAIQKSNSKVLKALDNKITAMHQHNQQVMSRISGKIRTAWNQGVDAVKSAAKKLVPKGVTQQTAKAQARLTTAQAKRAEKKLIAKAGKKMGGKFGRFVGNIARLGKAGAVGVTGAGGAAAGAGAAGAAGAAAAGAGAGAGAAAGGGLAAAAWPVTLAILIIIAIGLILNCFALVFTSIAQSVVELDNMLFGWIKEIKWPDWLTGKASEEDKKNVFNYTIYTLLHEEELMQDIDEQIALVGKFTSGLYTSSTQDANNVKWDNKEFKAEDAKVEDGAQQYLYIDKISGDPITQYSNVKLVMAMTHAFTYPMEKQKDLEKFSIYAVGLWRYLNETKLESKITFCETPRTYKYWCNVNDGKTGLYDKIVDKKSVTVVHVTDAMKKDGKILTAGNTDEILYVMNGPIMPQRGKDDGCRVKYYDTLKGTYNTWDKNLYAWLGEKTATQYTLYSASSRFNTLYNKNDGVVYRNLSIYDSRATGTYKIYPYICKDCADEPDWGMGLGCFTNNDGVGKHISYHNSSNILSCGNYAIESFTYETTEDITTYCSNSTAAIPGSPYQYVSHAMDSACSNSTYYVQYTCNGHSTPINGISNHGTFGPGHRYQSVCTTTASRFENGEEVFYTASGYSVGFKHSCLGHITPHTVKKTGSVRVCRGHVDCRDANLHDWCDGHTLEYCEGHIQHTLIRKTINSESSQIFSDGWTYTIPSNFLWFDTSKTYSPKINPGSGLISLARPDWEGWDNEGNKEAMYAVYKDDWYKQYDVGMSMFIGGQASESEIFDIKQALGITSTSTSASLMKNIDVAFEAIGRIPQYPGDKPKAAGYAATNNFGGTVKLNTRCTCGSTHTEYEFDEDGKRLGQHGLDKCYFAQWVYWTAQEKSPGSSMSNFKYGWTSKVTAYTKAGVPIYCKDTAQTGIYLGMKNGLVYFIGMGPDGWATVLTSASSWTYNPYLLY